MDCVECVKEGEEHTVAHLLSAIDRLLEQEEAERMKAWEAEDDVFIIDEPAAHSL